MGLETIVQPDNENKQFVEKSGGQPQEHAYNLDSKLFTPEAEKKEREEIYN